MTTTVNSASILNTVKRALGIEPEYDTYDVEIITHINSVFSTLQQLGVGEDEGFEIENAQNTWDEFLEDDKRLNAVRSYVFMRVRLIFDPPANSFAVDSFQRQVDQLEWRLNVYSEGKREDENRQ